MMIKAALPGKLRRLPNAARTGASTTPTGSPVRNEGCAYFDKKRATKTITK
jgi:hypothetical protein